MSKLKLINIDQVRADFPILQRKIRGKELVYLDSAATSLKPTSVVDAVQEYLLMGAANVHRGVHYLSEQATDQYEKARDEVRRFINAQAREEIIFTSGTTMAINLIAYTFGRAFLQKGDEILLSQMEHHSNIVPWQILCEEKGCKLKVIPIDDDGDIIWEEFVNLLSEKTKLLSIVYISNSLGTLNPIKEMISEARKYNVCIVVDAAQAIHHTNVDVQELDCDFLAFSGHKMYGPTGVGVLYAKKIHLDRMPPFLGGGSMIRTVKFEKTTYAPTPEKFEAGTPDIGGVIGLRAAINYIDHLGLENIADHEQKLLSYAHQVLADIPSLTFIGNARQKSAIISFVVDNIHPHDLGTIVDQQGVAIRTGHHCTQPVMERYKVPATARASLAVYNTTDDIDRLGRAIRAAQEVFK